MLRRKTACIVSLTGVSDEPRVRRQAAALIESGWKVVVVGYSGQAKLPDGWEFIAIDRDCIIVRRPPLDLALKADAETALGYFWDELGNRYLYEMMRDIECDAIFAHDYFTAPVAMRLADEKKIPFSVDVHEYARAQFHFGRDLKKAALWKLVNRPYIDALSRACYSRAALITTVCDGIADLLKSDYNLPARPTVIRSVPSYEKSQFRPTGAVVRVLYHGLLVPTRGLEQAIASVAMWQPDYRLVIRGVGAESYKDTLRAFAESEGVGDRVDIVEPSLFTDLVRDANLCDVGYAVLPDYSPQRHFTLPNKFFEYIMAGTALCVSDLPEMAAIVRRHDVGILVPEAEPKAIATAVNALTRDRIDFYKRQSLAAARQLCWEQESKAFIEAVSQTIGVASIEPDTEMVPASPKQVSRRGTILVLHGFRDLSAARNTSLNHLLCFERYRPEYQYMYYCGHDEVTRSFKTIDFSAIILDTSFLSQRTMRPHPLFERYRQRWSWLRDSKAVKVAFPQDEYDCCEELDEWLTDLRVDVVYSVVGHRDILYPRSLRSAQFHDALTGYVEKTEVDLCESLSRPLTERPLDLGYRARDLSYHYGRLGRLKADIHHRFTSVAPTRGFKADTAISADHAILGDDWQRFIASCRFMPAGPSGVSLMDPRGEIGERTMAYRAIHPNASFEEVEAACFPEQDETYVFSAISPRLLEAAAAGTCQILIEGYDYVGLEADKHYIPLKADFSNVDDVFERMRDLREAQLIADRCKDYLIGSENFSYRRFVAGVFERIEAVASGRGLDIHVDPQHSAKVRAHQFELGWQLYDPRGPLERSARRAYGIAQRAVHLYRRALN